MNIIDKLLNWYFTKNALPYWVVFILDCLICYLAGIFVFWLYYHGAVTLGNIVLLSKTIFMYMIFNIIGFRIFKTYTGIIRYSSFVDLQRIGAAMGLSWVIAEIMHYLIYWWDMEFIRLQGRQIAAMYLMATAGIVSVRVIIKTIYDVMFSSKKGVRTLIYGVKDGGISLAKSIRNEKPERFHLRGFIAHESHYGGRVLMGVKVYNADDSLAETIKEMNIGAVLVSPLQNSRFRENEKLQEILINAGIHIYMMSVTEEQGGIEEFEAESLREISVEDLLPRNEIHVDMDAVGAMLTGKKIMITGSAGSIGSEMVRQIAVYKPAEMILVDQAETPQHSIRLMMQHSFPSVKAHTIVTSITHTKHMEKIFNKYRPDYVFHAAAYKHVPMMEDNPGESIINNVYGTKIIADLSEKYGVRKFVMISTDKAVNPTNVMGCSKRICEMYVQSLNAYQLQQKDKAEHTQFVTTRFGNVLGSNGSVIPLFKKQIELGGPVTVAHPDIIRYFMLIPEACALVLEAGTMGKGGEVFVFDMGRPVKIVDLARKLIVHSGRRDVKIKFTGLRQGEKLYEEVLIKGEEELPTDNPKIRVAKVLPNDYEVVCQQIDQLATVSRTYDDMKVVKMMKLMVPEFKSNNSKYEIIDKELKR